MRHGESFSAGHERTLQRGRFGRQSRNDRRSIMTTAVSAKAGAATYTIDKAHSEVTFQVRHLLTKVRGRFSDFDGAISFDPARPEASAVQATIQAGSIDTNEPQRDAHLKSGDFFDVEKFPTLAFTSRGVTRKSDETYEVSGDLTIHGVTRPVTLAVTSLGTARDPWGVDRVAFEAETTVNRKDFGLNWNAALETGGFLVGDDVKIMLSVQAVPKQ
jgi:polyisoprenoid-binding protein YceI